MSKILYEFLYIVDAVLEETEVQKLTEDVRNTVIQEGGEIHKESNWGSRKLGYEIKKRSDGIYIYMEVTAPREFPAQLNTFIKTRTGILRHLLLRVPKAKLIQEKINADRARRIAEASAAEPETVSSGAGTIPGDSGDEPVFEPVEIEDNDVPEIEETVDAEMD